MSQDEIKDGYTVKGLVVRMTVDSFYLSAFASDPASDKVRFRRTFQGKVFHLPEGPENDKIRHELKEGRQISITTFEPQETLERAAHYPGTLTFDELNVKISLSDQLYAVDPRPACQVQHTRQHEERIAFTLRQKFNQPGTDPCEACVCARKKAPGPQV
ncbi:MAG: hypothetical protein HYU57_06820 [Micavibrio aeruginosavorus]|nr:hypothetical protein [Micavibrio aeruginosavorus]